MYRLDDKMLLYIVENYSGHEDPKLCTLAEKAWNILKLRGKRIEEEARHVSIEVPTDAKTSRQMLEEILENIRTGRE